MPPPKPDSEYANCNEKTDLASAAIFSMGGHSPLFSARTDQVHKAPLRDAATKILRDAVESVRYALAIMRAREGPHVCESLVQTFPYASIFHLSPSSFVTARCASMFREMCHDLCN